MKGQNSGFPVDTTFKPSLKKTKSVLLKHKTIRVVIKTKQTTRGVALLSQTNIHKVP